MIRVLVSDAQRLLAESLRVSLSLQADFEVLEDSPSTGLEAVETIVRKKPDVAVLDYWMTGMDGPAATRMVLSRAPGQKIVLLSWFHGPAELSAAKKAGAAAFLSKELTDKDLASAVRRVASSAVPSKPEKRVGRRTLPVAEDAEWERLISLTSREVEILSQLALCGRLQDAAKELSITENTMRLHIQHILSKTGARSQVEAVALARKHGLI